MKSIIELEKLGYKFGLINDISIKFTGNNKPDDSIVEQLIEEIRENKYQAISFIKRKGVLPQNMQLDKSEDLFAHFADQIKKSELLRSRINAYIKDGDIAPASLIDDLLYLSSLLCNDELFYKGNIEPIMQYFKKVKAGDTR